MREKLLNLMRNEGLTSSRLAELLGIQPSGISHILSGRNKPSLDFVQKILRRFPNINPDWLLLDQGPMYRESCTVSENSTTTSPQVPAPLFDEGNATSQIATPSTTGTDAEQASISAGLAPSTAAGRGTVKRIIVLFDDHTFESYTPS